MIVKIDSIPMPWGRLSRQMPFLKWHFVFGPVGYAALPADLLICQRPDKGDQIFFLLLAQVQSG
jgi:hypothetical protein